MEEIWKDIHGYEGLYRISNFGQVYSVKRKKLLKLINSHHGYKRVRLYTNINEWKTFAVHRLVAQKFIPNPNNLPEVNHKDDNHSNNNVDNLEWCTRKYNVNYGNRTSKTYVPVIMLDKENNFVKEFTNQIEAEKETGIRQGSISNCCRGFSKTAGGYKWRYKYER